MEHYATEELHVVVNHVPCHLVAAGYPMVVPDGFVPVNVHKIVVDGEVAVEVGRSHDDVAIFCIGKTSSCVLYDGIHRGKHFGESFVEEVKHFYFFFVDSLEDGLTFVDFCRFNLLFKLCNFCSLVLHFVLKECLNLIDLGTKLVVSELLDFWLNSENLFNNGANLLDVACCFVAE